MKVFKSIFIVLLVFLFVFSSMYTALAAVYIEDWGFRFAKIINGSAYEINKYIGEDSVVNIPNSYNGYLILSIGEYAFFNTSVTSVAMGKNVTSIEDFAFIDVTSLTEVTLDDNLKSIGELAFAGCTGLSEISIPAGVTEIADNAFSGCDGLTIYCKTDSYAHQYAEANNIPYVLIDAVNVILGDADGDGVVTIFDVTVIQRVLALVMTDEDGMIELRGSVDGEELNTRHATMIQRYLVVMEVPYPIGTEVTRVIPDRS